MQASSSPSPGEPQSRQDRLHLAVIQALRGLKARTGGPDPATLAVLHQVACHAPVRLSAVAEALHLDLSTVSRHVRGLEDTGYLERREDPADRRAALLSLTVGGRAALDQAFAARAEVLRQATADWPESDVDTLISLLDRLGDALGPEPEHAPSGVAR